MNKDKFLNFLYIILLFFIIIPVGLSILVCLMPLISILGFFVFIYILFKE